MTGPDDPTTATDAVEQRLRRALADRAGSTEPAPDALDRVLAAVEAAPARDRRRRAVGLAAAAAVLVVLVAVGVVASRPDPERVDTTATTDAPTTAPTTTAPQEPATSGPATSTPPTSAPAPPTTTTTTEASTTTPDPTTTAPSLPGGSTDPRSGPGTGTAVALLADVRAGAGEGYERIVVEFLDGHLPDWSVAYVDPPITQDGSGEPVAVAGDAFLLVHLAPAAGYDLAGEVPRPTYTGPDRFAGPGAQVVEVVRVGDVEAVATWAIGLRGRVPFRVTTLTAPARLVIDVAA